MSYCPFLVLGHNTTVMSRQESHDVHGRHTCVLDRKGVHAHTTGRLCVQQHARQRQPRLRSGVERTTNGFYRDRGLFCRNRGWRISCRDMVHCVATWVLDCSGRLGRDMNLDVATRPQAIEVFSSRDTNFDVATEVLHYGLKLGCDLILGVTT